MTRRAERLSLDDRAVAWRFLAALQYIGPPPLNAIGYHGITRAQYFESYQSWARGGHAWEQLESGGTDTMCAICWYQHIHRPGSKEWRPSIIIRALIEAGRALPSIAASPPSGSPE